MKIRILLQRNSLTAVLLSFVLVGLSGCSDQKEAQAQPPMMMATNVVGFKVEQKDLKDSISVIGTLQSSESVEIKSEINGTIQHIGFEEGQKVSKGDVLIEIEKNKLQAAYDQAVANFNLAESTATRYKTLVENKAVSQQEYDEASARLASNKAAVDLAREQLEDSVITAPFDGVMGERLVSVGQYVSQGVKLTSVFNQDPIKAGFHVPERFLNEIKMNQNIEMSVAAFKDKKYQGRVSFIDPKVDETTRTTLIKALLDNKDGDLREGMFASIELIVSVEPNALVVPETALIIKGDAVLIYVVKEDQTVDIRPIKTGKRIDGMVVIEEGLAQGDVVVLEGYQKIGPGSSVNVRFEEISKKEFYEII